MDNIWDTAFVNNIGDIASVYAQAPDFDPEAVPAWEALAADSMARFNELAKQINIDVVDDPEPYANADEMCKDIHENNHFAVSRANSEHPVWSVEENIAFRTVHDILGHCVAGGDFGWEGENRACAAHFPLLSPLAQKALFTECIAQTGYAINYKDFGPQKVVLLDNIFDDVQAVANAEDYQGIQPEESKIPEMTPEINVSEETGLPKDTEAPHQAEEAGWPEGWYDYEKGYPRPPVVTKVANENIYPGGEHGFNVMPPLTRHAPGEIKYYHVAPTSMRPYIERDGLQAESGNFNPNFEYLRQEHPNLWKQPLGNYMYDSFDTAWDHANWRLSPAMLKKIPSGAEGYDIWEITPKEGTILYADPEDNLASGEDPLELSTALQEARDIGDPHSVRSRRWYSPEEITPDELRLVDTLDEYDYYNSSEFDEYLDLDRDTAKEELTKVPWQTYIGKVRKLFSKKASILDEIHDQLDPEIWDKAYFPRPVLKPEVANWVTTSVIEALARHGYTHMDEWLSLVVTGSLTTYQYSPTADLDISLFVDAEMFPEWSRAEMIAIMMDECDDTLVPGTSHPLQCYVVSNEFTKEDLYQPGLRSAYDISTGKWLVAPEKDRSHDVKREMNEAYTIALENADKMEKLIRYEPLKAIKYYDQVHRRRRKDMQIGKGDYSPSNITYKMMDSRGLFKDIKAIQDKINQARN